nr:PREDICTED: 28S ribosomal protein S2, mitochondrial isoform X2 [Bemisia tabaci]
MNLRDQFTKCNSWSRKRWALSYSTQTQPAEAESTSDLIGSKEGTKRVSPLMHEDFFNVHSLFTMNDLFDARVHYGHKEGSLNNFMRPYIFGSRLEHLIFDLDKTAEHLRLALNIAAHIAYRDGIILFIGQTPQNAHLIEATAKECGAYAHTRLFQKGLFSNSTTVFNGITRLPDLCIFFNTLSTVLEEHRGVAEAAKMNIATIGIVDTNCDPRLITYPVPGNDDSPVSQELYCKLFKAAILKGQERRRLDFRKTIAEDPKPVDLSE